MIEVSSCVMNPYSHTLQNIIMNMQFKKCLKTAGIQYIRDVVDFACKLFFVHVADIPHFVNA